MLTNYLADIDHLLDEQHWEGALREAFDLPHIAVALADSHLRSSVDRLKTWCAEWVRPLEADRTSRGLEYERVYRIVCDHVDGEGLSTFETVPALALRRLRLRRLSRTPPRGFNSDRSNTPDAEGADAVEICSTLVDAARRWYAHSACHDATVQANLARLAVLR
jgi:hypothetical protein